MDIAQIMQRTLYCAICMPVCIYACMYNFLKTLQHYIFKNASTTTTINKNIRNDGQRKLTLSLADEYSSFNLTYIFAFMINSGSILHCGGRDYAYKRKFPLLLQHFQLRSAMRFSSWQSASPFLSTPPLYLAFTPK